MADQTTATAPADTTAPAADSQRFGEIAKQQIAGGVKYRNSTGANRVKRWKQYDQIAANNFVGPNAGKDAPVVNLMAARTRAIGPQLAFHDPSFDVRALGTLPDANSEVAIAAMLERTWLEERFRDPIRSALLDWPSKGIGAVFVGFEAANEADVLDAKRAVAETADRFQKQSTGSKIIEATRKIIGVNDKNAPTNPPSDLTSFKFLTRNRAFVEHVSTYDLVLDPCATSQADCQFMARRIHMPLTKATLMFGAKVPEATSVANVAVYTDDSASDPFGVTAKEALDLPDEVKRIAVWEHWNIAARKTSYLDERGNVLLVQEWKSPYPGFPIVCIDWDAIASCPWPEGLMAGMHSLNNELNEIRRRELAESGKAFGVYRVPKSMSLDDRKKLEEAKDGAVIPLDVEDVVESIDRPALPPDFWGLENRIKGDLDEISRTTTSITGRLAAGDHTATEASYAQSGADAVMADRQRQVEEFVAAIADRVMAIFFATFDEPVTVTISNQDPNLPDDGQGFDAYGQPNGMIPVGTLTEYGFVGVDHAGFYRVTVASGSMASVARDVERQQAAQIAQLYGREPWFDLKAFAMVHLGMFSAIRDPGRFIVHQQQQTAGLGAESAAPPVNPADATGLQQSQQAATIAPNQMASTPSIGMGGSGNAQADLLAATLGGGAAPGTGTNGFPTL